MPEPCSDREEGLLLAMDLGTTLLKVGLLDCEGRLVALGSARYPLYRPRPGQLEQRPEDWYRLLAEVASQLWRRGDVSPDQVIGIGLSGRGGGGVFLDATGRVLVPCWLDWRGASPDYLGSLGKQTARVNASTLGMAARLLWLRQNLPDAFAQTRRALLAKDYVLYRLTGEFAADESSGPMGREWPPNVFEAIGFDSAGLPAVLPLGAIAGHLSQQAARDLGLRPGLPVSVGGHDGVCASIGSGMIELGHAALTLGTTAVVRMVTAQPLYRTRSFSCFHYHFLEGRWACGGDAIMAGKAVEWAADALAADLPADKRFATLESAAAEVPAGAGGLLFSPFFAGTVAPRPRANATGAFRGLTFEHRRGHLFRAALEGVGYALLGIAEELEEAVGPIKEMRVTGGGSRSRLWIQCLADILQRPIGVPEDEASCRGAALLLALGLGYYVTSAAATSAMVRTMGTVEPRPELAEIYSQAYAHFLDGEAESSSVS